MSPPILFMNLEEMGRKEQGGKGLGGRVGRVGRAEREIKRRMYPRQLHKKACHYYHVPLHLQAGRLK
jgi:hypothetical protein